MSTLRDALLLQLTSAGGRTDARAQTHAHARARARARSAAWFVVAHFCGECIGGIVDRCGC